jgi:hypothetical protein
MAAQCGGDAAQPKSRMIGRRAETYEMYGGSLSKTLSSISFCSDGENPPNSLILAKCGPTSFRAWHDSKMSLTSSWTRSFFSSYFMVYLSFPLTTCPFYSGARLGYWSGSIGARAGCSGGFAGLSDIFIPPWKESVVRCFRSIPSGKHTLLLWILGLSPRRSC